MSGDGHIRLGLNLPYVEGSMDGSTPRWADILAMSVAAERVGFDSVWVSDHVGFGDPDGDWSGAWESWTLLSALAATTTRVELGTYVLAMPFRHPALLAKQAETLDEVSGGRLILGIGAGWNDIEFETYGVPVDRRFDRFEDGLRIIAAMLRDGRSDHVGRLLSAPGARLGAHGPRPNGPPIMVGATGPRMLRLTAELADHWNGGMRSIEEVPALLADLAAACADVEREPSSITRSVEVLVRPGPSDGIALEDHEIRGTASEIAAGLTAFADLGIDELQVQLRPNSLAGVEGFAPVIEALRAGRRRSRRLTAPGCARGIDTSRMVTSFDERSNCPEAKPPRCEPVDANSSET